MGIGVVVVLTYRENVRKMSVKMKERPVHHVKPPGTDARAGGAHAVGNGEEGARGIERGARAEKGEVLIEVIGRSIGGLGHVSGHPVGWIQRHRLTESLSADYAGPPIWTVLEVNGDHSANGGV